MYRNVFALVALASTSVAHASPGWVAIDQATSSISISVRNVSGSSDVNARQLEVTSAAPLVHVEGDYGCSPAAAHGLELSMGDAYIHPVSPPLLFNLAVWDSSPQLNLQGPVGPFTIDYAIDLPTTWDPNQGFSFALNAVEIVESYYATAAENNADLVDWMRSDQVFVADFEMNAVLWCDDGQALIPAMDTVTVGVDIFYHGDPNIDYQPVAGTGPGDVDSGATGTPGYDATGTGTSDPDKGDDPITSVTTTSATSPTATSTSTATR